MSHNAPPRSYKMTFENSVDLTDEMVNGHSNTKKDEAAIMYNKEQSSWPGETPSLLIPLPA